MQHLNNPILNTDSYKMSQRPQYPEGSTAMFSYIESRGGISDSVLWFGMQYILLEYVSVQITMAMIDEAEELITRHGLGSTFDREGWEYIVTKYDGYLPVTIKAVDEGSVVPTGNVLATIECHDPRVFWIVGYIETMLLRVWYPTTVATKSYNIKKTILAFAEATSDTPTKNLFSDFDDGAGDPSNLFKLHDFGFRGASSFESAGIGGLAHLVNFLGTDTVAALQFGDKYYGEACAGFSIPASEHSTMTALGREGEAAQFEKMIDEFGGEAIFACVSDGYDIYNAINNIWGGTLKQKVIDMDAMLVIRPDSGDPVQMPIQCVEDLDAKFGHTVNSKGYKVLNHVRVIQGDGIDSAEVKLICANLMDRGYSIDNIAFGMGGGLLQKVNRDDHKFACKNSWMLINGQEVNVYKDPITDPGKTSKKGRLMLIKDESGYRTVSLGASPDLEQLGTVYEKGEVYTESLWEIRLRAEGSAI